MLLGGCKGRLRQPRLLACFIRQLSFFDDDSATDEQFSSQRFRCTTFCRDRMDICRIMASFLGLKYEWLVEVIVWWIDIEMTLKDVMEESDL